MRRGSDRATSVVEALHPIPSIPVVKGSDTRAMEYKLQNQDELNSRHEAARFLPSPPVKAARQKETDKQVNERKEPANAGTRTTNAHRPGVGGSQSMTHHGARSEHTNSRSVHHTTCASPLNYSRQESRCSLSGTENTLPSLLSRAMWYMSVEPDGQQVSQGSGWHLERRSAVTAVSGR